MKKTMQVLLVEEDEDNYSAMAEALGADGHRVIRASNGQEARLKQSNQTFDFIILNMETPGLSSLEFVRQIRTQEARKSIKERVPILVNGSDADDFQRSFSEIDNIQFILRPFTPRDFLQKMKSFKKRTNFRPENLRKVAKGEALLTEGTKTKEMYWVLEGSFLITKLNNHDQNVVVGEALAGELVGEMSFLDKLPRSASVIAKEDSEVLVIPHKKFMDVLDDQPRWFRSLMSTLSHRLRDADKRIAQKYVQEASEEE